MSLKLRWVGAEDRDRVAETRMLCYAPARRELSEYVQRLRDDPRTGPGDWLLAEDDGGQAVGTATGIPMTMWVRGSPVPCQGVAHVGTIKTFRRKSGAGVATAVMNETLRMARERGFVVSALMPFRGTFYEHFGYGFVERAGDGPIRSCTYFEQSHQSHLDTVKVVETLYDDMPALRRVLAFLGSLRDQYSFASVVLPADLRVNWLLREAQMTHRANRNHPTAEARPFTRMQVRVLDHIKLLGAMKLPATADRGAVGKVVVAVRETEGDVSKLAIDFADGRAVAASTDASADVEMSDRVWAMVALGDVPASRAVELGLIAVTNWTRLGVLDLLAAAGPAPFCREYF